MPRKYYRRRVPKIRPRAPFGKGQKGVKRSPTARILWRYRREYGGGRGRKWSWAFLGKLNQALERSNLQISYAMILDWEADRSQPEDEILRQLIQRAQPGSWPWLLANDLLAAKHPDRYKPVGRIGIQVLNG